MANNDRAGEQVFANIDEVLAGKIISRSKENAGGESSRVRDAAANDGDGRRLLGRESKSIPVIRIVMAATAVLILVKLMFMRGDGRNG